MSATPREVYTLADLRDWPAATAGLQPPLRLAVFGDPVAHSASPPMHNAALAAENIDARYTRILVRPEELPEALRLVAARGFLGVNLTIPHKAAALPLLDAVDAHAAVLGVVNTVRIERTDGEARLRGFNTDGPGFARAVEIELGLDLENLRVLILGAAGGAGRALAAQCVGARCPKIFLVNRTFEKARALMELLGPCALSVEAVPWETAALQGAVAETDLIVNASSVGLQPGDGSPLPPELIPARVCVFDTVYRRDVPATPLVAAARQAGARTAGGLSLLLHQGALSFEHWFGRPAPLDVMRAALANR